ncbi:SGNH/GDSL hydrolase family protein [Streptomyces hydrogenans]|uniref:Lipoprotein n=1 Tax=Streptomyces hydrogenans TaxID=1873719 RepID=A0ABQ3P828_9ACTN|nr:SGNH/GDSL hydrolase family protein [Streptomyces hydrogenans]GHG15445.1 lipoprotein [Streptomyces hydrogenans]GHI21181.1 lipoprotein [Streptomyces hydrogenans]
MPYGRRRIRTAVVGAVLAVAALAGCTGSPAPRTGAAASTGPTPTPTPTPTPVSPWDDSPASVAAVGDSVTRAFDACSLLADCPEASWATGTDPAVNSLALRLLGPGRVAENSWNLARSGARVAALPEQMGRAAARRPELVTVMIGANDACRPTPAGMTPVAEFRRSFEASLARLRKDAPKARVYVASVPDLRRLWDTGRANPLVRRVWELGVCGAMLADPEDLGAAAERRRTAVRDRVVAYNEVLAEVCARDERCRYDGGAVFGFRFDESLLSTWDWFHPSREGQARLAELAYRRITEK